MCKNMFSHKMYYSNLSFYYMFLSSTFLLPFICEVKGRRKASKRRRKSTLLTVGLVDINRLDKSSSELLDLV